MSKEGKTHKDALQQQKRPLKSHIYELHSISGALYLFIQIDSDVNHFIVNPIIYTVNALRRSLIDYDVTSPSKYLLHTIKRR